MLEINANLKFLCPFGCIVSGPSMSGKSHFILGLIKRKDLFDPPPDRIVYTYNSWQKDFDQCPGVDFVWGIDGLSEVQFDPKIRRPLLCSQGICTTRTLVFFAVQNLFKQGKSMRDVALNSQVIVLFKSPRDVQQIRVLARQTGVKDLEKAYLEAIKDPYGYLVINLQPHTPDTIRLQTDIFNRHRRIFRI